MEAYRVSAEVAHRITEWLNDGRGVAIWDNINMSSNMNDCLTPARSPASAEVQTDGESIIKAQAEGAPTTKPGWQYSNAPRLIIETIEGFEVITPKEVKRFHVGVQRGDGLSFRVTDGGTRRIKAAVEKAGDDAWYEFDYEYQDAIIFVPGEVVPLKVWQERNKKA